VRRLIVLAVLAVGSAASAVEPYCQGNPAVIYCNDFETGVWDGMESGGGASVVSQGQAGAQVFDGVGAAQARFSPGGADQPEIGYRFSPGVAEVWVRFYVRFDASWTDRPMHHFYAIHGDRADDPWSCHGDAGCRPNGTLCLSGTTVDHYDPGNGLLPGEPFFYTYFQSMSCDSGGYCSGTYAQDICDGCAAKGLPCGGTLECCWGNAYDLNQGAPVTMQQDRWYAMETRVKANTPGLADGEESLWIDGVLVAQHAGFDWRDTPDLLLNHFIVWNYFPEATSELFVWFDNVVVSTAPIGLLGTTPADGGVATDGAPADGAPADGAAVLDGSGVTPDGPTADAGGGADAVPADAAADAGGAGRLEGGCACRVAGRGRAGGAALAALALAGLARRHERRTRRRLRRARQRLRRARRCTPWLLVLLALLAACTRVDGPAARRQLELTRCHLGAAGAVERVQARCGSFEVPEDWEQPAGAKIPLRVAVVPAASGRPLPDPLLLLAGGPGQAATEAYVPLAGAFARIHRTRDIVLVDQRGTGGSHPLRCEGAPDDPGRDLPPGEQERLLRECAARLGPGVAHYTTSASLRDLDEARRRLGYDRVNLYGVSYGTRVALSYMRAYPGQVRSAILDGVLPQDAVLGPAEVTEAPARARRAVLQRCAAEPACHARFPRLREDFDAVDALVRATPTITVPHPRLGTPVPVTLTWERWSLTLRLLGYGSETLGLLPHLVHAASERRDLAGLAALSVFIADQLSASIDNALQSSVLCAEDWPFFTAELARALTGPYGRREVEALGRACAAWPHRRTAPEFKQPVRSSVPTLLLSGELDPVTPPAGADRAQRTLPVSLHVVAPGQGHGVIARGCVPELAARFVAAASVAGLDTACVTQMKPLKIFLDPSGPEP
jgi:pimeloyl-ACP methyl ester carboxylesterase